MSSDSDDQSLSADGPCLESEAEIEDVEALLAELRKACRHGHFLQAWSALVAMERLSEGDVDLEIDKPDEQGETALTLAAINGHANIVEALLDKGADNTYCSSDDTPLPMVRQLPPKYKSFGMDVILSCR
jgi:ankyrin repeat protein